MCTYPVQPICTFSCTSVFILIFINPQYTVLHILSHCTSYSLFYFIICSYFHSHLYLYIYSFVLCFIAFFLFCILFFCTFHWSDLSWLTFHYWLYPVWLCMWQIIKNLEPWTLWGSGLVSLLASQAHQHHGHLTNLWCFWQCGQVLNPAGKWNQHL